MKEIYVNRNLDFMEIAITEDKKLIRYYKDEENTSPKIGDIYKGVVKKLVPALKGAFIDIGYEKNAFLYIDKKLNDIKINQEDEILIQVLKEEIGNKGAKVTNNISIPGKYAILLGEETSVTFSKKIDNEEFKEKVKKSISEFYKVGIKIRTEAQNVELEEIIMEIEDINNCYEDIIKRSKFHKAPFLIYKTKGILYRILIDLLDKNTSSIILNSTEDYEKVKDFIAKRQMGKVEMVLYSEEIPMFEAFGVKKSVEELNDKKVYLPCGGYLIIEKTEAMHVVDVNSGKNVKSSNIAQTALSTNLEAAIEIGRQVILRNLGGIIIVDFIDMLSASDKQKVLLALKGAFEKDKNKSVIYPFTELNLVQIARRRGEV